ncbi:hypothetical protein [Peribacillus alkalitolerans]|uniref:hypothetical protein n=1 Tax=Peribacillus alkalitolerans TaxID=1550385 RepID=UPI001F073FD2|nr:hypothetical protein [Peribacillus alkalitolerans]
MSQSYRRPRAYLSTFTTTHLHLRNPWVIAFFAFSYPGFGNLMLHKYGKAFILILWEMFINQQAKINLGIMYSLQGHFEKAKDVLDERWLMLYVGIYIYAMWDSYRSTIDLNKQYILSDWEDAPIKLMKMSAWGINHLDKREPWMAMAWSFLIPGLGHLYVQKLIVGFFIFIYTLVICYFSHLPQAIQFSFTGDFSQAKQIIDMQWFIYIPSIYTFIIYDAYISAIEQNKLFEKEQSQYLRKSYQSPSFHYPLGEEIDMLAIATFEQNTFLELALTELDRKGIKKDKIFAVPLDKRKQSHKLFDSIHYADGMGMLDIAAILGTCLMLLGAIYGYELKWGPILWGIIGAVTGIVLGIAIKLAIVKKKKNGTKSNTSEVVVMIQLEVSQKEWVEKILWENHALGVSTVQHSQHNQIN